jgi:hypothetical protein
MAHIVHNDGSNIMRRFLTWFAVAFIGFAGLPSFAQAQVIVYSNPPAVVTQPVTSYYPAPITVAPSISYRAYSAPTYSYYPSTPVYSYSAPVVSYPAPVVSYSAPVVSYSAPVVTYAAPAAVLRSGVVETRSYYGYGIFRPRGHYTETRVYP